MVEMVSSINYHNYFAVHGNLNGDFR